MNSLLKVSSNKILYSSAGLMFSVGFYRGCQQYNYNHIKCKNKTITFQDIMILTACGFINATLYINPALIGFALYDEQNKIKMLLTGNYDEKQFYFSSFDLK
jgi:hypothetical protein